MTTEDRIIAEKDGSLTVNVNGGEATLVNKDLTNELVAWMRLTGNRVTRITLEKVQDSDIPLYTHTVKANEK